MSHPFSQLPVFETLEQVRAALMSRIPETQRDAFFTTFHPLEILLHDAAISEPGYLLALELIQTAIQTQKKVLIFGDYDCDGITATATLWLSLRSAGLTAKPFLPRRDRDGYGLTVPTLEMLWQQEPFEMLITVDNGIVAHQAVNWLREKNVEVIITDHHTPSAELPEANAIVHSTLLCGAGVAWMVARGIHPSSAEDLLDLVAIGTLADQVPLYGANRSLAIHGLKKLRSGSRPSIRTLAQLARIDLSKITSSGVTFQIAPRLNAMGRLGDPMDALRALVSRSPERLEELLSQLEATNHTRQDMTLEFYTQVQAEVEAMGDSIPPVLIVFGEYHEGIIGLLASRLVDDYQRPAIVISTLGEVWKASCRSLPGFNVVEALRALEQVQFVSLGGHELAAGFSLDFRNGLEEITKIKSLFSKMDRINQSNIDSSIIGTIGIQLLNSELLSIIQTFQPFGAKNQEPSFMLQDILYTNVRPVGATAQHWKAEIKDQDGAKHDSIFFKASQKYLHAPETVRHAAVRLVPSTFGKRPFDIQVTALYPEQEDRV